MDFFLVLFTGGWLGRRIGRRWRRGRWEDRFEVGGWRLEVGGWRREEGAWERVRERGRYNEYGMNRRKVMI